MGNSDHLVLGDWNAACFECGAKFKASQLRKNWKGYYTCSACWEPRHPQDFVGPIPTEKPVPWSQPQTVTFVESGVPDFTPYDPLNPPEE